MTRDNQIKPPSIDFGLIIRTTMPSLQPGIMDFFGLNAGGFRPIWFDPWTPDIWDIQTKKYQPIEITKSVRRWKKLATPIAKKYGIDPELVLRVIQVESGGNPNAVSKTGAIGLMQLMPATARSLGVKNPKNPRENIAGGVRYLRRMLDLFGEMKLALAAYNAGPGNVRKYNYQVPPFKETRNYIRKILGEEP